MLPFVKLPRNSLVPKRFHHVSFLVINLHVIKYSEGNGTKLRQATTK